jgi:hypothetical protein
MIRTAIVLAALLVSPIVHAQAIGFVDVVKAVHACAEAKKTVADRTAAKQKQQADQQAQMLAATKLKQAERIIAEKQAKDDSDRFDAQTTQLFNELAIVLQNRALAILPAIAAAHHLGAVSAAIWAAPKFDYTAELTKRLDAGDGKPVTETTEELKKELADEKAENVRLRAVVGNSK